MTSNYKPRKGGRKPRKPRGASRASATASRKGSEARGRLKRRIIGLESRLTVLEAFLGIHDDQPPLQEQIDSVDEE